jgi:MFS family permease
MLFVAAAAVYYLPRDQPQMRISFEANLASFWRKVSQGYHFIHSEPLVFLPLALLLFFQVFLGILVTILPSFGREILAISVEDTAPLLIVPAGLGALAGIFLLPSLLVKRRKKELVEAGMILASFTLCLMGTVLIRQGEWRLILGPILTFLLGLAAVLTLVPCQTLIQEKTPASLRGRVFGALNFLMTLVTLPPLLVAATVVDLLGVTHLILLVGLSTFLIYLYSRWQGDNALIPTNHRS